MIVIPLSPALAGVRVFTPGTAAASRSRAGRAINACT